MALSLKQVADGEIYLLAQNAGLKESYHGSVTYFQQDQIS